MGALCVRIAASVVGSYCAGCVAQRRKAFERKFYSSGRSLDYPIAFAVSCGLAAVCMLLGVNLAYFLRRAGGNITLGGALFSLLGQWWAGVIVTAVYHRRSRYLKHVSVLGMLSGSLFGGYVAARLLSLNPLGVILGGLIVSLLFSKFLYREIM